MPITVLTYHVMNCYLVPAEAGLLLVDADVAGTLPLMFRNLGGAGGRAVHLRGEPRPAEHRAGRER